jgi:hypothetical protein
VISDLEDFALRSPSSSSEQQNLGGIDPEVTGRANDLRPKLQLLIEKSLGKENTKVDELLELSDSLTGILASPRGELASGILPISQRSRNKGTGLTVNIPSHNGSLSHHHTPSASTPNGHVYEGPSTSDDSDEELSTPRLDKGKQRAADEPERPTPVLRRPSLVLGSEYDYVEPEVHPEVGISPTVDR